MNMRKRQTNRKPSDYIYSKLNEKLIDQKFGPRANGLLRTKRIMSSHMSSRTLNSSKSSLF